MYILFIILFILFIGYIGYNLINRKKIQQNIENDYLQKNRKKLEEQLLNEKKIIEDNLLLQIEATKGRLKQEKTRLDDLVKNGEQVIEQLEKRKQAQLDAIHAQADERKQLVEVEVEAYRTTEMQKARTAVESEVTANQKWAASSLTVYWDELAQSTYETEQELQKAKAELEDYRKKQQAVNEAILRQRELDEKQDFYRVCLSPQSKEDIKYLLSIIDNIKNKQLLYKLIWSEYLQKPFNELLKRLFVGKDPRCVIYKITNLKTGEIYIGKTKAEVSKRWTEHIKTSLNIGTVARSKIHDALFSNWDNFSFEILEKVEDETQLSSREKFYISFYQSNISGYNMNSGG